MKSTLSIRITVRGRLSTRLATRFDGLTLVRRTGATELVGEVVDQTQLHGLLTSIRDLGLQLESVNVLDADQPNQQLKGADMHDFADSNPTPEQRKGAHP